MLALDHQPLFLAASAWQTTASALDRLMGMESDWRSGQPESYTVKGGLVSLEVSGVILKGVGGSEPGWWFDLDDIHRATDAAIALTHSDPGQPVTLLLRIESGGGYAIGLPEATRAISAARAAGVNVISYTENLCASAALWIGCTADFVACAPSAQYGSIGAYNYIDDASGMFAAAGVERTVFRSGSLKGMGLPGKEVTEEEKAARQESMEATAAAFFAHVRAARARNRATVPDEVFETAAVYSGEQAHGLGLVDILEDTEPHLLRALAL